MASTCISRCVDDARVPVRATYVNLYKWPESDFEFVRSMRSSSAAKDGGGGQHDRRIYGHPRVVDSFSCRQLYLRSYTFSREEDYADEDKSAVVKCLGRSRGKENPPPPDRKRKRKTKSRGGSGDRDRKKGGAASCSVLASVFRRLLSCTTKIDVVN